MWHNIQFNSNLVQYQTDRAVLIKLPEDTAVLASDQMRPVCPGVGR